MYPTQGVTANIQLHLLQHSSKVMLHSLTLFIQIDGFTRLRVITLFLVDTSKHGMTQITHTSWLKYKHIMCIIIALRDGRYNTQYGMS